jgi:hypothetical protein
MGNRPSLGVHGGNRAPSSGRRTAALSKTFKGGPTSWRFLELWFGVLRASVESRLFSSGAQESFLSLKLYGHNGSVCIR